MLTWYPVLIYTMAIEIGSFIIDALMDMWSLGLLVGQRGPSSFPDLFCHIDIGIAKAVLSVGGEIEFFAVRP